MTSSALRKGVVATATVAMTFGGAGVFAAPASAEGSGTACPTNRVCFYFNSDFGGARADYRYSDANMGNELFTDGPYGRDGWGVQVNNNAASVKNRSGSTVYFFDRPDCTLYAGESAPGIGPGVDINLASVGLKNKVSSFLISDGSACVNRDQSNQ